MPCRDCPPKRWSSTIGFVRYTKEEILNMNTYLNTLLLKLLKYMNHTMPFTKKEKAKMLQIR
jgi:hypothetical protein